MSPERLTLGTPMNPWPPPALTNPAPAAAGPRRKTHRRYLAYRVFALSVLLGWNALFLTFFRHGPRPAGWWFFTPLPLVVPAVFMVLNWAAFPLPYSVFGPFERSAAPDQASIYTVASTSAQIGRLNLNGPFADIYVLPAGVALRFLRQKAFLPREAIVGCERLSFGRTRLTHRSPEVRSPIVINDRGLADMLSARPG